MHNPPSALLIQQRIRNRIIEYLAGVEEYPRDGGVWDLNELINEWETWVDHPFLPQDYPLPPFSADEVTALATTHEAWLAFADSTPQDIKYERGPLSSPEWRAFVDACSAAIKIFELRGRLPEDAEMPRRLIMQAIAIPIVDAHPPTVEVRRMIQGRRRVTCPTSQPALYRSNDG